MDKKKISENAEKILETERQVAQAVHAQSIEHGETQYAYQKGKAKIEFEGGNGDCGQKFELKAKPVGQQESPGQDDEINDREYGFKQEPFAHQKPIKIRTWYI